MRVWTIVYDENDPTGQPQVSLIGGLPTITEMLLLIERMARLGAVSMMIAPPPEPSDGTVSHS